MKTLLEPRTFSVSGTVAGTITRTVENSSVNSDCDIIAIQKLKDGEINTVQLFVSRNAEFAHLMVAGNYVDVQVAENIAGVTGYMEGDVERVHITSLLSATSAVEVSQDVLDELGKSERVIDRILAVRAGIKKTTSVASSDDHIARLIAKYQAQADATPSALLKNQLSDKILALKERIAPVVDPLVALQTALANATTAAAKAKAQQAIDAHLATV